MTHLEPTKSVPALPSKIEPDAHGQAPPISSWDTQAYVDWAWGKYKGGTGCYAAWKVIKGDKPEKPEGAVTKFLHNLLDEAITREPRHDNRHRALVRPRTFGQRVQRALNPRRELAGLVHLVLERDLLQ